MIAVTLGILLGLMTIGISRQLHWENWAYSACLILLPLIYMFFGLFADGEAVILTEFLFGIPYFVAGILCIKYGFKRSGYVVAVLWLLHGLYDMNHAILFTNSGVPSWYPVFCAGVDIVVGLYLLVETFRSKDTDIGKLV